jgi:predicted CXXCH cytochrome family protein
VGYDPDINNGGYDEVPVARLANVSCENCHGPGSEHNGDPNGIAVSFDANTCGSCHQDEHHPYIEEWSMSAHATSLESAGGIVTQNPNCIKCHISEAFVASLKTGTTPEIEDLPSMNPINCMTCHDPHSHASDGQLRIASVDLVCGECHTSGSIADVEDPGTPHHSQWNMLHGTDGLEYQEFEYPDSPHQFVVEGKCASCHVSMEPFGGEGSPAKTGHTFEPELRACLTCHPNSTDFDINGVQTSITLLTEELRAKLDAAGDTESIAFKQASYNLEFVEADASHGVHNYKYTKALLESSITNFNP